MGIALEMKRATTTCSDRCNHAVTRRNGYVASLGHPGGNITGVSADLPGGEANYVELLRDVVPGLKGSCNSPMPAPL